MATPHELMLLNSLTREEKKASNAYVNYVIN